MRGLDHELDIITMEPHKPYSVGWPQLQLTKAALLVILVGLCVVERRITAWPLVTWPMYCCSEKGFPPPSASAIELRVTVRAGGMQHKVTPLDILSKGRNGVVERAMQSAFDDANTALRDANRTYLTKVVERILRAGPLDTVEGWRLEWAVDPLALPPLDRDHPVREVRLGGFSASHYSGAMQGP